MAYRDQGGPNSPTWRTRVVCNSYPAASTNVEFEPCPCSDMRSDAAVYEGCHMPAFGAHEVIVETTDHETAQPELSEEQIADTFRAYRDRILHFCTDPRFKSVQVFKNHGNAAGASMRHSHSQLIALPVIMQGVEEEVAGAKKYYDRQGGRCVFCDCVAHETEEGKHRLIDETDLFVSMAPYAPRFPYETWIIPKTHRSNFEHASDEELEDVATILKRTLLKFNKAFDRPPYNYMLHTAQLQASKGGVPHYHWNLRIVAHLVELGGFELGSGCHLNTVAPEEAAKLLREIEL